MNYLTKLTICIFIFTANIANNSYAKNAEKIIFSVKDKIYTSIDLDNRFKYLKLLYGDLNITKKDAYDDLVNISIFNQFYEKNNQKIDKDRLEKLYIEIFNQYENSNEINIFTTIFNSLDKKIIIQNIEYDWEKKTILQGEIENQRKSLVSEDSKNNENNLDIYDYQIQYLSIDSKHKDILNNIKNNEEFIQIKDILSSNNISYIYKSKDIKDLKKIDKRILDLINKNQNQFIFSQQNNILIGKISKKIKDLDNLKITMIQISSKNLINENILNCNNLDKLKNIIEYKVIEHKLIEYKKINNEVKSQLKNINDKVYFQNEENNYLMLCRIDYNKETMKQYDLNNRVQNLVTKIESRFIKIKKIEYNFINYE